jgi:hypothetical protein
MTAKEEVQYVGQARDAGRLHQTFGPHSLEPL